MITQEELHELFDYREDGFLLWKIRLSSKISVGDVAGYLSKRRYVVIIHKKAYQLHQLIWIYHHGNIEKETRISRLNNNHLDNRIENLILTKDIPVPDITKKYIQNIFTYKNGSLYNKIPLQGRTVNKKVGKNHISGYRTLLINNRIYSEHRIIWIYHFGNIPKGLEIDHINRIKDDNRIENLRLVTHQENTFNKISNGYYWNLSKQKWHACIRINNKLITLGFFNKEEEARSAYLEAKKKYHIIKDRTPNNAKNRRKISNLLG